MAAPPADAQLESLIRRFSKLVRAVASRVGGREIADDVEQQVFLNLWKQLEREQTIDSPSSYIYRCAVRETIRLLQAEGRSDDFDHAADVAATSGPAPDERVASRERAAALAEAIRTLSVDRRRAVQGYLAGFSVAEVMQMYGWSYQRARNLSARGMADLRAELRRRGIDG